MHGPVATIHIWNEHDTWWNIAAHFTAHGGNWVHLIHANPHVKNPNKVALGTRIYIPVELLA